MRLALTRARLLLSVVLPPLLLGGCFDFEEREVVLDLRALSAQADPPEVMVVVKQGDDNGTLFEVIAEPGPTTIRVLAVNPQAPAAPITATAYACVSSDNRTCVEEDGPIVQLGQTTGLPGTLELVFEPSAAQLNAWLVADPYQGYGGLFIQVVFELEQAGFPNERVAKVVTYNVPFVPQGEGQDPPPPKVANRNPRLDGLLVEGALRTEAMGLEVAPGQKVKLEPVFNQEIAVEEYPVIRFPDVSTGDVGYSVLTEKLEFQFYTTDGKFGADQLATRNVLGNIEELETTYTAPKTFEVPVTVWVVTRDDRGGVSWTTWDVRPPAE